MSQKLILSDEFDAAVDPNKTKKEFIIIPTKNRYQLSPWRYRHGRNMLSHKDNIKSLKIVEKKITKAILSFILTDTGSSGMRRIVGDKLHILENIEQGELDYGDKIWNDPTSI